MLLTMLLSSIIMANGILCSSTVAKEIYKIS